MAGEIAKFEAAISAKIKSTPHVAERAEIIESVPGFAEMTSANLIAGMPELGQVSNEIAAALLGAAPYGDGKRHGKRHIKSGRRWVPALRRTGPSSRPRPCGDALPQGANPLGLRPPSLGSAARKTSGKL